MHRLLIVSLASASFVPAFAQQSTPPAPLSPAMQGAIDRIIHGNPPPQIVPPGAALILPANPTAISPACSIPLLEMRIDHPEQFSMQTTPAPKTHDPMPTPSGIAPACPPVPVR
jgi:hypothetical protein